MSSTSTRIENARSDNEECHADPPAWLRARRKARRYRSVARGYAVLGIEVIFVESMKQFKLLRRGLGLNLDGGEDCH